MAQFPIGHVSINFNDAQRTGGTSIGGAASTGSGRAIGTEVYYPAVTAGNNTTVANGPFPLVVFGHGFAMTYDAYTTLFDSLARNGYIVAMVTTEGSIIPAPSHDDFGHDLAVVVDEMLSLNVNNINGSTTSPFIGRLNGRAAIGGHSMGGGATFLADHYTTNTICYFTFGAAETTPSAITAAASISKPHLVVSGSYDCVAPPNTNQDLMYNALTSACKQQVTITKGYHCEFADASFTCGFGEGTCITAGGLSSVDQQTITRMYLEPYLDYYLKGVCPAWTTFQNLLDTATIATVKQSCNNVVPSNASIIGGPSFCAGTSTDLIASPSGFNYLWNDSSTADTLSTNNAGNYSVIIGNGVCQLPATSVVLSILDTPAVVVSRVVGTLVFQSTPAAEQVSWFNSQGNNVGIDTTFTPLTAGDYYALVTDSSGCIGTSNLFNFTVTSSPSFVEQTIRIYPNPTSNILTIELPTSSKQSQLQIFDLNGRLSFEQFISSYNKIDLSGLSKGLYMLSVINDTQVYRAKLTID